MQDTKEKPCQVNPGLILLLREPAQVNWKGGQNPGGRSVVEPGFDSQSCQTPDPMLGVLPKVTQAVSTEVIP